MTDPYITGITHWLRDAPDWHAFWADLTAYPQNRGIRLHLHGGASDHGPFAGTGDVTGMNYSPEPDGYAAIVSSGGESLRNHLRVHIEGFTPLE